MPGGRRGHRRGHGRSHDGGPEGGGRRRIFDSGELALVLLHLTEAQPRHGYELIREIEALTAGAYAPSPGIVYPTLTLLEDLGQIEAQALERSKRVFALTEAGRARLAEQRPALASILSRLGALKSEARNDEGLTQAGPVWRAMQNLRTVLQQRVVGTPGRQFLFDIADLIDETARTIERL
jgi:DNA-binding PadR family transcriptional regulator